MTLHNLTPSEEEEHPKANQERPNDIDGVIRKAIQDEYPERPINLKHVIDDVVKLAGVIVDSTPEGHTPEDGSRYTGYNDRKIARYHSIYSAYAQRLYLMVEE